MTAYRAEAWHDLFVMGGGAAAALAGLIFVAVSLNHEAILAGPALPALAARTLSILVGEVLLAFVGLTPAQTRVALGVEVLIVAVVVSVIVLGTTLRFLGGSALRRWRASLLGLAVLSSLPAVIAGASLVVGMGGGLYWVTAQYLAGTVVAVYYAWILLIEIRR